MTVEKATMTGVDLVDTSDEERLFITVLANAKDK